MEKIFDLRDHRDIVGKGFLVGDKKLWLLLGLFVVISLLSVMSASSSEVYKYIGTGGFWGPTLKHFIYLSASVGGAMIVSRVPPSWLRNKAYIYSLIVILMIALLPFIGKEINGARRWIQLGFITIQPSEFFKLCLIFWGAIAGVLAQEQPEKAKKYYWIYWLVSGAFIVFFGMENLSTAIIFCAFVWCHSFIMRAPWRMLLGAAIVATALGVIAIAFLILTPSAQLGQIHERAVTWKNRITNMADDDPNRFEITDANRQEQFGKIALANSQLIGSGIGASKVKEILPMAYSDFIYAIIIEEYGLIGMIAIPGLYVWWFVAAGLMARREKNRYRRFLLYGIGLFFPMQALVNIAVVAGFLMTGQTLPLISAGGSSLIVSSVAMGIMINISNVQRELRRVERQAEDQGIALVKQ